MQEREYLVRADNATGTIIYIDNIFGRYHVRQWMPTEDSAYSIAGPYKAIGYAERQLKAIVKNSPDNYNILYLQTKTLNDDYGVFEMRYLRRYK